MSEAAREIHGLEGDPAYEFALIAPDSSPIPLNLVDDLLRIAGVRYKRHGIRSEQEVLGAIEPVQYRDFAQQLMIKIKRVHEDQAYGNIDKELAINATQSLQNIRLWFAERYLEQETISVQLRPNRILEAVRQNLRLRTVKH